MTEEKLWALTPREYCALRKVWEDRVKPHRYFYAGMQATLHNAWFRSKEHHPEAWSIWDWLPDEDRPEEARNPFGVQTVEQKKWLIRETLSMAWALKVGAEQKESIN